MGIESAERLYALRRRVAAIERVRPVTPSERVSVGYRAIDDYLGGGLMRGRLHEFFGVQADDASTVAGFASILGRKFGGPLVWLRADGAERQGGQLHGPGLTEIGFDPAHLLLVVLADPLSLLRAAAEVVRCPEVGVAVIELWKSPRHLDLTATRRLAVSAEASGVTPLMLRIDADPQPSAAETRWAICSAASTPLEANAPGHPAFEIKILRQRGGSADASWRVEWNRDEGVFRELACAFDTSPLSGAVVSAAAGRPTDARRARRAG